MLSLLKEASRGDVNDSATGIAAFIGSVNLTAENLAATEVKSDT